MDIWDVKQYSDEELFNILDINNPTDRELEAAILSQTEKYNKQNNPISIRFLKFYNDMYDHFFDSDDDDLIEPFDYTPEDIPESNTIIEPLTTLTSDAEYITKVNQTVNIIVDSRYRNTNVDSTSTNFTFDLSTTIKNVSSMYLNWIKIPATFYNIGTGENYFLISGKYIDGINYYINIPVGNYTDSTIIDKINDSISDLSVSYTDISFGTTSVSYNNEKKTTITVDISKHYGENVYKMIYNPTIITDDNNEPINQTVFDYLGLTQNVYNFSSIYSLDISNDESTTYYLDSSNNYFDIIQYVPETSEYTYNDISNITIIQSYRITLTLPIDVSYTRFELQDNLNTVILSNEFLSNSGMLLLSTSDNQSKYYLNIQLNRNTTSNLQNNKIVVVFPTNSIWTSDNTNSAFYFKNSINELNIITSDNPIQSDIEIIITENNNIIMLKPNSNNVKDTLFVTLTPGTYTSSELVEEITAKLQTAHTPRGYNIAKDSYFKINNNYTEVYININQVYTSKDYTLLFSEDLTDCCSNNVSSTLGVKMGFEFKAYDLGEYTTTNVQITSENILQINQNQYFYLSLNDYTNNGIKSTVFANIQSQPDLHKDTIRSKRKDNLQNCVSIISFLFNDESFLTEKELYSAQSLLEEYNTINIKNLIETRKTKYTNGFNSSSLNNILITIPNILNNSETYIEMELQSGNDRIYTGNVNLSKFTIKLLDSFGNIVDLNGGNFSLQLICNVSQ